MSIQALSLPSELPKSFDDSLTLALILSAIVGEAEGEVSLRTIQVDLVRSSRGPVIKRIRRLNKEGWLDKGAVDWVLGQGQIHDFGPRFTEEALLDQWLDFSDDLLGPGGYLTPHRGRAQLAWGELGPASLLLIELVRRNPAQWTKADIARVVTPLMVFDTAQQKAIDLHQKKRLFTYGNKRLSVASDVDDLISQQSSNIGEVRATKIARTVLADRDAFYTKHGASLRRLWLKRVYKDRPCIRCGQASNEIEHFPPRSWGGFDDWFTTFPICTACNGRTRLLIQRFPPSLSAGLHQTISQPPTCRGLSDLSRTIVSNVLAFYEAADVSDVASAHARALECQLLYRAFRDASLGEITPESQLLLHSGATPEGLLEVPSPQDSHFLANRPPLNDNLTGLALRWREH